MIEEQYGNFGEIFGYGDGRGDGDGKLFDENGDLRGDGFSFGYSSGYDGGGRGLGFFNSNQIFIGFGNGYCYDEHGGIGYGWEGPFFLLNKDERFGYGYNVGNNFSWKLPADK